jgi:anthranilate phosphoribosyltransferase
VSITVAASILTAACGVPVLLHGEPGIAPKHGLTVGDVLERLGVATEGAPETVERTIGQIGIGYLRQTQFAPDLAAIKDLRDELALRSPLNMVEKIYDPAGAPYHLIGLTHVPYLDKLGGALIGMGFRKTALVQGMEGNEDLPTNRGVRIIEFAPNTDMVEYRLNAVDFGLASLPNEALSSESGVGKPTADRSVQMTLDVLRNDTAGAWKDIVLFNSGFRILLAERARDLGEGIALARKAIDSGAAQKLLAEWQHNL